MAFDNIFIDGRLVQFFRPELLSNIANEGFVSDRPTLSYKCSGGKLGVDERDKEALNLLVTKQNLGASNYGVGRSINCYSEAASVACSNQRRIKKTCQINRIFTEKGVIRRGYSWINGTDIHNALTVMSLPQHLADLLKDLESFSSRIDIDPAIKAIVLFTQLLLIHPFGDGNGRTARVLLYSDLLGYGFSGKQAANTAVYYVANRHLFRAAMFRMRQDGDWTAYLKFWQKSPIFVNS